MIEEEELDWIMFIVSCLFWGLWRGTQVKWRLTCLASLLFFGIRCAFFYFFIFGMWPLFRPKKKKHVPFCGTLDLQKQESYLSGSSGRSGRLHRLAWVVQFRESKRV